jgi:hypothetical protein
MGEVNGRAEDIPAIENEPIGQLEIEGRNPHYRPPVMKWNCVEVVCPEESHVRVAADSGGLLSLEILPPGNISHLSEHERATITSLPLGHRVFVIRDDTRGSAVEHEFTPDAHGVCTRCERDGEDDSAHDTR